MKLNNNDDSHNSGLNLLIYNMLLDIESHPAWVCGLKQGKGVPEVILRGVTPCVGVWIETLMGFRMRMAVRSHPAWVCGLKRKTSRSPILLYGSHPAWVCGLKLKTYCTIFYYLSHTLRGCVD